MRYVLMSTLLFILGSIHAAPEIVLGGKASRMEHFAAREVQRVWQAATGQKLQIVTADKAQTGDIVIGTPNTNPAVNQVQKQLKLSANKPDEAAVYELNGILYLAGIKPRTAVDAAMLFLRECVGARWLWWGEDGEFIPKHDKIDFNGLARNHQPGIALRRLAPKGIHMPEDFELYLSRNFGNYYLAGEYDIPHKRVDYAKTRPDRGLPMMLGGHNAYLSSHLLKKRPELFALVNGRRNHNQLCLSHPDNPQLVANRLAEVAKEFGDMEEIRMSLPDNMSYCRCEKCAKETLSVLYFRFIDGVAENLKKQLPGVRVATLAYQGYLLPPKDIKLQHIDRVDFCPYGRCFTHTSTNPECPANQNSFRNVQDWRDTGVAVGIYGYFFDSISPIIPMPMGGVIAEEVRRYREQGVTMIDPEIGINKPNGAPPEQQASVHFRLLCYIYLQLMYNPDIPVAEIVRDWSLTAFGPEAGPVMTEYYLAQIAAYEKVKLHLTGMFSLPYQVAEELFSGDLGERCETLLAQATAKVSGERYRTNIEREQRLYRTLRRAAQSTLRENFALLPLQNEGDQIYSAGLGTTGADIRYSPESVKIRISANSEILLATVGDENSNKFHTITVSKDGQVNHNNITSVKLDDNRFEVSLPFTWLKTAMPLPGETWRLGIRCHDKYYPEKLSLGHNFDNFAYAVFSGKTEPIKQILTLLTPSDLKRGNANAFRNSAHELGFMVDYAFSPNDFKRDLNHYNTILLRTDGMKFTPENFVPLKQAVEHGAVLIVSAPNENPHLEKLFGDPAFAFKREEMLSSADARHAAESEAILAAPHDLKWFGNRYPPLYSLIPVQPKGWQPLLTALDKKRETVPFMNFRRTGKGLVIVSGCTMGFGDRWRSFGELPTPLHTIKLFANLITYNDNNQP